jgi:peroxiredoxin
MSPFAILASAALALIGQPAPDFTGKNLKGESVSLSDFKGKVVVLEWNNFDCPFVKKHYASGNMPKLQKSYVEKDVVWLTINSSAEGAQGHAKPEELAKRAEKEGNQATHYLMDTSGAIGKAFGAKVTPHMFVISKDGMLVYDGAMDSKSTVKVEDIASATPLLKNAIDAALEAKAVENPKNQPYGCGVKY